MNLKFDVRNFGSQEQTQQVVELWVDRQRVDSTTIDVPGHGQASGRFGPYRFETSGEHVVEIRLASDALTVDNSRWLSVPVKQQLRVLCIDGKPSRDFRQSGTGFLVQALRDGQEKGDGQFLPEVETERALRDRDLSAYDAVFLSNVAQFNQEEASALHRYVSRGGGLVVFLGEKVRPESYNQWLGGQDQQAVPRVLPARLGSVFDRNRAKLGEDTFLPPFDHEIVRVFERNPEVLFATTPITKWFRLELATPEPSPSEGALPSSTPSYASANSGAEVALRFINKDPAIVAERIGRGRSILVATSADLGPENDRWNYMPSLQNFLPLVRELLAAAVVGNFEKRNLTVGEPLSGATGLLDADARVTIKTPWNATDQVPVRALDDHGRWSFAETDESGVYEARVPGSGGAATADALFTANVNTAESDLAKVGHDELREQLPAGVPILTSWQGLQKGPAVVSVQRWFVDAWVLSAVLGLLLLETLLAWWFGTSRNMIAFALPTWLQRLFGVAPAESGEGTQWGLATRWTWPYWLTLLLVVFCIGYVAYCYYRERRSAGRWHIVTLAGLRMLALALVLFMIAGVLLIPARTGLPYMVVMMDVSASMANADNFSDEALAAELKERLAAVQLDEPSRANLAKTLLLEDDGNLLRQLETRYKLKFYTFADSATHQAGTAEELLEKIRNVKAEGPATHLGRAVRSALTDLRGTLPSAVIVLTDGINTEGESLYDAAAFARDKNVPLVAIGIGSEEPLRNLRLSDLTVDEVVYVDDIVTLECQLTGPGFAGRQVEVTLREKDKPKKLAVVTEEIPADGQPKKVRLRFRPTREEWQARRKPEENYVSYEFQIEVEALKEEKNPHDNVVFSRPVKVVDEKIRVLLVQSYPNFEFKYLKSLLEREESIEVTTVLQEADPDWVKTDKSARREHVFPVRSEELNRFDVIVFGDVNPEFLDNAVMNHLAEFVKEKGRSIVFIAGQRHTPLEYRNTPLAPLFPFDLSTATTPDPQQVAKDGFRVRPTPLGLASPHMQLADNLAKTADYWQTQLHELYWLLEIHNLSPAARVLAEHPSRGTAGGERFPVFIEQFYGSGRVLFHATDETCRWRIRLPDDLLFRRYWVQTLRYLSRAKLAGDESSAELTVDRDARLFQRGETVRFRVRFRDDSRAPVADDGVTLMVEREGNESHRLQLRRAAQQAQRGIFEGSLQNAPTGKYHAWIAAPTIAGASPTVDFLVESPPGEAALTQMNAAELRRAAAVMKAGRYYTLTTAHQLLDDLPEGEQVVVERLEPFPLWNWPPVVLLLLAVLAAEWVLRKRKGLL